jgi:two-component system LytT family response regulator
MRELRVLVVEDEPDARRLLVDLLGASTGVAIVAACGDGLAAVAALRDHAVDVVFLDVQLPELDAFEVIETVGAARMPAIVFVTAHDEYAVRAFEVHALDYLVKPFSDARFAATLARVRDRLADRADDRVQALLEARARKHLLTRLGTRSIVIPIEDITWIEAQDYYVLVHTAGRSHLLRQSIRELDARLDPVAFARVNRSAIVNLDRVRELRRMRTGWTLTLVDGTELPVSRRRRDPLARLLRGRAA